MRAWPKAFEWDYKFRQAFESACEAQAIYGTPREVWSCGLDKATEDMIWNKANELLNLN